MAQIIKSLSELNNAMDRYCKFAVDKMADVAKAKIEEFIRYYYEEYPSPEEYQRTWAFLNSVLKTEPKKVGNGWEVIVYIDTDYMYASTAYYEDGTPYRRERWSMLDTAKSANDGWHGYTVQIGDGIHFWDDAVEEIKEKQLISNAFVKFMKEKGLNVTYK